MEKNLIDYKPVRKVNRFGAYLQSSFADYYFFMKDKEDEKFPSREKFRKIYSDMQYYKVLFDLAYSREDLASSTHPLNPEKTSWGKLSLDISDFLKNLNNFKRNYSRKNLSEDDKVRTEMYLGLWRLCLEKWNEISKSAKGKNLIENQ